MSSTLETLHARLESGVERLVSSDEWAALLSAAARFHNYSIGAITFSNLWNSIGAGSHRLN